MELEQYRSLCKPRERAIRQLLIDFEFFCEDVAGLIVVSVESRTKPFPSAIAKAQGMKIAVQELQDLAGIRIVVGTTQAVEAVRRFFSRQQDSDDLVIESDETISRPTGYRSRHLVVRYAPKYARSIEHAKVEVQIPTLFQHAFNQLSRAWVYKSHGSFPKDWKARFRQLSEKLDELNGMASEFHEDIVTFARSNDASLPVSPFSYQRIVRDECNEHSTLEHAVDAAIWLQRVGINNNQGLVDFLHDSRLENLWSRFRILADAGNKAAQTLAHRRTSFWSMFCDISDADAENILATLTQSDSDDTD